MPTHQLFITALTVNGQSYVFILVAVMVAVVVIVLAHIVLLDAAALNRSILSWPNIVERETKAIIKSSLCPADTHLNIDQTRIPKRIEEVTCTLDSTKCYACYEKEHQCVQLLETVEVYYRKSVKSSELMPESETITYNSGCVCVQLPLQKGHEIQYKQQVT